MKKIVITPEKIAEKLAEEILKEESKENSDTAVVNALKETENFMKTINNLSQEEYKKYTKILGTIFGVGFINKIRNAMNSIRF